MKNIKRISILFLILVMAFALAGCNGGKEEPIKETETETVAELELYEEETEYIDSVHRTDYANLFDFDSYEGQPYFAVAFLGYGEDRMDFRHTYVEGVFEELGDFAIEQIGHINYDGDEWYLVVPRYKNDVEITNLDTGEVHTIKNGEAFTVKCNLSDIHPNIEISTEDGLGGYKFSPQMGGDGKLVTNTDIHDITDYSVMDESLYVQEGE